jgi:pilus assembly protein TadC
LTTNGVTSWPLDALAEMLDVLAEMLDALAEMLDAITRYTAYILLARLIELSSPERRELRT